MTGAISIPESVVTERVCATLTRAWIVHVQKAEGYQQDRIRGYYLKTQMRLTSRGGNRAAFAANQTQSRGVPDLLVRMIHWPSSLWLAVELKAHEIGARGEPLKHRLQPEQKYLLAHDGIVVASTPEQVMEAIGLIDGQLVGV